MSRSKRLAAKESWENKKAHRALLRERQALDAVRKDQNVQIQIARDNKKKSRFSPDSENILRVVESKAPKLLDNEYIGAIKILSKSTPVTISCKKDIHDWVPQGKGRLTQFISLAEYLWAEYPVPKFLWSVFWEQNANVLCPIVQRIAAGESFAKMCQSGHFPLPLNRKQCHRFLNSPADRNFMKALRQVQFETHGGNARLFQAWMSRDVGKTLHSSEIEMFWDSVIAWLCKNPMLDLNQLGPLLDYITYRKNQDKDFSMKGRSVLAVIRGMNEWHGELTKQRNFEEHNYKPSGFKCGHWEVTKKERTGHVHEIWRIEEILSSKELHKEGSTHHHCVASYGKSISSGHTSIWSMSRNDEKMITIEVRNLQRRIVQARGRYNRMYDSEEYKYMLSWAQDVGLIIDIGRW